MELIYEQQVNADRIHKAIKGFQLNFPDEFVKTDIKACGHCNATGLRNRENMNEYCEYCHAIGFVGFEKIGKDYICRSCNGIGCEKCQSKGTTDWIEHAMGSDIQNKRRELK